MSLPLIGAGGGAGSVPPGSDLFFSSTVLLMGFEGADASTGAPGMTDESFAAHGLSSGIVGQAQIDTAQFKFGTSSLLLNTVSASSIQFNDSADWQLSTANSDQFTIELFVRFAATGASKVFVCQSNTDGTECFSFQTKSGDATNFSFYYSPDGTFASEVATHSSGAALTTNTWYALAVDKDSGGKIRLYKDGTMVGSSTPANSAFFNSAVKLVIGATAGGGAALNGWIDEIRITKGVARYASDGGYTVTTAAFPRT